jgi:hypothetical protein
MTGDICSIHPDSAWFTDIFSIECKTGYPTTSFWQHFTTTKFAIEEFWLQALEDADKGNKQPMLIYRKKNRKWIVGISKYVNDMFKEYLYKFNSITVSWGDDKYCDCILYDLDAFFSITPQQIKESLHD